MDNKDKAMVGAILPIIIIPVVTVILINIASNKFSETNAKFKQSMAKAEKEIDEKNRKTCEHTTITKVWSENTGILLFTSEDYYVTLSNGKTYEISRNGFGKAAVGEKCDPDTLYSEQ